MRYAKKTDINQSDIVAALRKIPGVSVAVNHDDILVGYRGKTYWYEIKSSGAVSRRSGLIKASAKQKSQKKLEINWTGHYEIVSNLEQVLIDIGIIKVKAPAAANIINYYQGDQNVYCGI